MIHESWQRFTVQQDECIDVNRRHNSYTMGCPPVRGDNPRALAEDCNRVLTP